MNVNRKITKKVDESVLECRKNIVNATIELLKSIGAESGEDVLFRKTLFIFQHKENTTETIVCDRIMFGHDKAATQYYFVSMDGDKWCRGSYQLSLDSLNIIYKEVLKVVRAY